MKRRIFLALLGGAAGWSLEAQAQQAGKARRIGFLRVQQPPKSFIEGFRRGLREHGLIEDQNIVIEWGFRRAWRSSETLSPT